jgi:DNA-binding NtrC family response regulator
MRNHQGYPPDGVARHRQSVEKEGHMADRRRKILIVDDEATSRESLCELLRSEGYTPVLAEDGLQALGHLQASPVPLVIADLKMPRLNGLELVEAIEARHLPTTVVLLTGNGSVETAVEAMKRGAYDYLTKPVDPQRLLQLIPKALEAQRTRDALRTVRAPSDSTAIRLKRMIGTSAAMKEVFSFVEAVAGSNANVLILGESGTGKELVARAIHELSPRATQRYVSVNSAALPPDLLENELFGHERGAFTGAVIRKEGCFELANRGTLFLDEVADTSLATQAKLLRVLEGHPYRRLGGTQEITVDVRVISATNQNVDRMIDEGLIRSDLYFRLSPVVVHLPPLRDRVEDIPLLVREFLAEANAKNVKQVQEVAPAAMETLMRYPWPGNVRELRNAMEHAVIMAPGGAILPEHLPLNLREPRRSQARGGLYLCSIDEMEQRLIEEALARFPTKTRAAEVLGISLRTLYNKLHRYGLNGSAGHGAAAEPAPLPEPWVGHGRAAEGDGASRRWDRAIRGSRARTGWPDAGDEPPRPLTGGIAHSRAA